MTISTLFSWRKNLLMSFNFERAKYIWTAKRSVNLNKQPYNSIFTIFVQQTHNNLKECHPCCVGKIDRWEGSQKHNSYDIQVFQEEWTKLRESVPYVKIYRHNPKHLCPKLNGYGDKGQRKVWSFCGSTYCTWFAWRNTHTLRIVRPCLQLAQARSSLRLHM